jgi:hypothetical protein
VINSLAGRSFQFSRVKESIFLWRQHTLPQRAMRYMKGNDNAALLTGALLRKWIPVKCCPDAPLPDFVGGRWPKAEKRNLHAEMQGLPIKRRSRYVIQDPHAAAAGGIGSLSAGDRGATRGGTAWPGLDLRILLEMRRARSDVPHRWLPWWRSPP